jgi:hypothetical protein
MVGQPFHATSVKAAEAVRKVTLRQQVIDFAMNCLNGFTDSDLKDAFPWTPESSMRKRRTELAQENIVLDSGRTRLNRHGHEEIVWQHRYTHPCPPDVVTREYREGPSAKIARLEAEVRALKAENERLRATAGKW